jgi:V8-like Glu-specific endopeptidase
MKLLSVLLPFLLLFSCGKNTQKTASNILIDSSIKNGKNDIADEYNNVAYLKGYYSACTSTVIHPYIVLTAAHCVNRKSLRGILISKKVTTYSNQNVYVPIEEVISNKKYAQMDRVKGYEREDIALIILKEKAPIAVNDIVPLISKEEYSSFNINKGNYVTIVGFGQNENGGVSGDRKYKRVEVVNNFLCRDNNQEEIWNLTEGAAPGDSGGPAFFERNGIRRQIGIASTISEKPEILGKTFCKRSNYTNIVPHLDWIKEETGYYPGVDIENLNRDIEEKYDHSYPLLLSGLKSRSLNAESMDSISITTGYINIKQKLNSNIYSSIEVNLVFCKTGKKKCKKISELKSTHMRRNTPKKFDSLEVNLSVNQLKEYSNGELRIQIEKPGGLFKANKVLAYHPIPTDLRINYTQRQIDKKVNLRRFSKVKNDKFDFELFYSLKN